MKFGLLDNLSIRTKIGSLIALLVIGFLSMILLNQRASTILHTAQEEERQAQTVAILFEELKASSLKGAKLSEEFMLLHDATLATKAIETFSAVIDHTPDKNILGVHWSDYMADLNEAKLVSANLIMMVDQQKHVGLGYESGLSGIVANTAMKAEKRMKAIAAAAATRDACAPILAEFLLMREHELAFRLSKDTSHIDDFKKNNASVIKALGSSGLTKEEAEATRQAITAYSQAFADFSEAKLKLDAHAVAFRAKIDHLVHSVEKQAKEALAEGRSAVDLGKAVQASAELQFYIFAGVLVVLISAIAFFIAQSITRPIGVLVDDMAVLSQDNPEVSLSGLGRKDEIGAMFVAVKRFKDNLVQRLALEAKVRAERQQEVLRQNSIQQVIDSFGVDISALIQDVANGNQNMVQTADILQSTSNSANGMALSANEATQVSASNVQTVASAAEELSASIREIAEQSSRTYEVVNKLRGSAKGAQSDIGTLSDATKRIGDVVDMIQAIAEQTNLLALNATIEAARAGDAGKGFAVVAAEVKQLSNQTSKATEEIANQITAVQSSTEQAVNAINAIASSIDDIDGMTASIASSAEQQDAATSEISSSIQKASEGTSTASSNVVGVSEAIGKTNSEAENVRGVSDTLANCTDALTNIVQKFLSDVASDVKERRRSTRIQSNDVVSLQFGTREYTAYLHDRSEGGLSIIGLPDSLKVGDTVKVEAADGAVQVLTCRWRDNQRGGFEFKAAQQRGAIAA